MKKLLLSLLICFFVIFTSFHAMAEWVLVESCGVLDGWHQSVEIVGEYRYVVDYFHCSDDTYDSGDMCSNHPCEDCSSKYCAEGSEKYNWVEENKNLGGPPDQCDLN